MSVTVMRNNITINTQLCDNPTYYENVCENTYMSEMKVNERHLQKALEFQQKITDLERYDCKINVIVYF